METTANAENEIEDYPLVPYIPANTRVLFLGSFPPPKQRWSMDFFYPNVQNDMWRIWGILFFDDKEYFLKEDKKHFDKDKLTAFLYDKKTAFYDMAQRVRRTKGNASDQFLEIITPTAILAFLSHIPSCKFIVTTGEKASSLLGEQLNSISPKIGTYQNVVCNGIEIRWYRMPSTSRAYPMSIAKKAEFYRILFEDSGILESK